MADRLPDTISALGTTLMTAVVRSGCVRTGRAADYALGARIMREELKAFIIADEDRDCKYVDERALALTGGSGLAMASLVAECIRRILVERDW